MNSHTITLGVVSQRVVCMLTLFVQHLSTLSVALLRSLFSFPLIMPLLLLFPFFLETFGLVFR